MLPRLLRVAAASTFLLTVACGGDDGGGNTVSAGEYAASICGEVGEWFGTIQAQTQDLQDATDNLEGDLDGAKEQIQRYLDEVIEATDELLNGVGAAGEPDVDEGDEVAAELQAGFERVRAEFEKASGEIDAVSTDDAEEFVAEFERIGGRLQDGSALEDAFSGLERFSDNEDLDRAFDEEDACQELSG